MLLPLYPYFRGSLTKVLLFSFITFIDYYYFFPFHKQTVLGWLALVTVDIDTYIKVLLPRVTSEYLGYC